MTTIDEIETQARTAFSVRFETLTISVINGALEQGYLRMLANPAYLFIASENMEPLLDAVVKRTHHSDLDAKEPVTVTKWVNQTTGRIMDIVSLPGLDQHTIVFGFLEH